jgi:RecB family exonuclease
MGTYSHSKLDSFRKCPRQFYYRYIAQVPLDETPEQIATFLGSRVHEALDHLYARARDEIIVAMPELIAHFREKWQANWNDEVVLHDKDLTPAQHRAAGERCIRDYYSRYEPFNKAKTIGLERKKISFPRDDQGQHRMRGFIDRLARTPDGTWQVHDYKTNRHLPTQADKDVDPQLAYYEIGVRRMWKGVERVELVWHFLRFDQSIVSSRTPKQLCSTAGRDEPACWHGICARNLVLRRPAVLATGTNSRERMMSDSHTNIRAFQELVRRAPTDARAEQSVRGMLRGCADSCPMDVLVQLGQCLVDARTSELRFEAESN